MKTGRLWHLPPPPPHGTWPHHQITPDPKKKGVGSIYQINCIGKSLFDFFHILSSLSRPFHLVWMRPTSLVFLLCSRRLWLPCTDMILNLLLLPSPPASAPQPNCWCRQYIQWCVCGWAVGDQLLRLWKLSLSLSSWEISLYELDTFFASPTLVGQFLFGWKSRLAISEEEEEEEETSSSLWSFFFWVGWESVAEQVVITSRQLLSFSFYSINKQRCDAILWLISILS